MKTVREALFEGASLLTNSETPFLDVVLLLSHVLGISKEQLFASYPDPVSEERFAMYSAAVKRRKENYPVSYIRNEKEFFGLTFYVDERVLVPRPDTETLVESALKVIQENRKINSTLDLCTGSGCIGITIKHVFPDISVTCTDISPDALEVCKYNSTKLLGTPLPVIESNLFENIKGTFGIILSNPPYLKKAEMEQMKTSEWPEPYLALDGGDDGLIFIRKIIENAIHYLIPGGFLLLESAIDQTYSVEKMMISSGYTRTSIVRDLTGRNRVTMGRKPVKTADADEN